MTQTPRLELPVRIDFLGGWTDQECWPGPGAVLNAAVGWEGRYPLAVSEQGDQRYWNSAFTGEGTGLGVSSIRHAALSLLDNNDYPGVRRLDNWALEQAVRSSVAAERNTTRGGWQDAAGALFPGLKVVGGRWPELSVLSVPPHFPGGAIFNTVVLFDTGIRRDSAIIGEKVRHLIRKEDRNLRDILRRSWEFVPKALFDSHGEGAAKYCISAWRALCNSVPEADVEVPVISESWGHKLCGAGGGGYGLYFCSPEKREAVRDALKAQGLWATIPELLPGPRWVPADE